MARYAGNSKSGCRGYGLVASYGFLPSDFTEWLAPDLPTYPRNITRAKKLIESLGFVLGSDGYWYYPNGTKLTLELMTRPGTETLIAAIVAQQWKDVGLSARVVRSEVLSIRQRAFVDAARVAGAGQLQVMLHIVLPNILPLVSANALLAVISGIMSEASLSFLGIGDPSQMSWGTMIYFANIGGAIYHGCWTWVAVPGLCIALFGLGMHLLTSAINVVANLRLRRW
jgi:ABC-type dipeptide/oligopeptide/nickel transport system permease subunit